MMTAAFVLSCILWVKGDFTTVVQLPISEYGTAALTQEKSGFLFKADVMEESLNSISITQTNSNISAFATAYGSYDQKGLMTKLIIKDDEASLDCDVRRQK